MKTTSKLLTVVRAIRRALRAEQKRLGRSERWYVQQCRRNGVLP